VVLKTPAYYENIVKVFDMKANPILQLNS